MHFVELIQAKRGGKPLTRQELEYAIAAYTADEIPDYQMAAFVMAVFFKGMNPDELGAWTNAMLHSGEILNWEGLGRPCVDKHSTGGVGDKISIPLAPAVAACGAAVPMISGRGLGHTGGTLDKLESIPGFQVRISESLARRALEEVGAAMMGQTDSIAPADKRLYALRDATGTVESIPLIASSIMSKKLAEGIQGLVLDVKVGSGAFMKTPEQATLLARTLVGIGNRTGCATVARMTRMDRPLGRAVGNALEIAESVHVLRGEGPQDVRDLVVELGAEMLCLANLQNSLEEGRTKMRGVLDDGSALDVFRRMVAIQGGDPNALDRLELLPQASRQVEVRASHGGYITEMDTAGIGMASLVLGAGREKKSDAIDPAVGVVVNRTVGDRVEEGEGIATLYVRDEQRLGEAVSRYTNAVRIGEEAPAETGLFLERIDAEAAEGRE